MQVDLNNGGPSMYQMPGVPAVELYFDLVLDALKKVRLCQAGLPEVDIQGELSRVLTAASITHVREHKFGPRCRADIWVSGIAIEVKKERPPRADLMAQIRRYAAQPTARGIIVVLERSVIVPDEIEGKRVAVLSLNSLWGIAL